MTPEQLLSELELMLSPTVTIEQAARILGVSEKTVSNYHHAGKLGAFKPGGGGKAPLYFYRDELERFKQQNYKKSHFEIESEAATYNFNKKAS